MGSRGRGSHLPEGQQLQPNVLPGLCMTQQVSPFKYLLNLQNEVLFASTPSLPLLLHRVL